MIVRSLDGDGDWLFGRGKNDYLTFNAAIAQSIQTRLSSFLGDCFFDIKAGVDWWNILGSKSELLLNLQVSAIILNTFGVTGISQLLVSLSRSRNLTVTYAVTTIYPGGFAGAFQLLLDENGNVLTDEFGDSLHA